MSSCAWQRRLARTPSPSVWSPRYTSLASSRPAGPCARASSASARALGSSCVDGGGSLRLPPPLFTAPPAALLQAALCGCVALPFAVWAALRTRRIYGGPGGAPLPFEEAEALFPEAPWKARTRRGCLACCVCCGAWGRGLVVAPEEQRGFGWRAGGVLAPRASLGVRARDWNSGPRASTNPLLVAHSPTPMSIREWPYTSAFEVAAEG